MINLASYSLLDNGLCSKRGQQGGSRPSSFGCSRNMTRVWLRAYLKLRLKNRVFKLKRVF
jgi:hypothetical protein